MSNVTILSPHLRKYAFQRPPHISIEQHLHLCRLRNRVECLYFSEKTSIWKMNFSELSPYLVQLRIHFDVKIDYRKSGHYIVRLDII